MPVYAKKVQSSNPRFLNREIIVATPMTQDRIPVPNNVVLCCGCNQNIHEMEKPEGYLVYFGKRELQHDRPYDIYCYGCLKNYFPKVIMVE